MDKLRACDIRMRLRISGNIKSDASIQRARRYAYGNDKASEEVQPPSRWQGMVSQTHLDGHITNFSPDIFGGEYSSVVIEILGSDSQWSAYDGQELSGALGAPVIPMGNDVLGNTRGLPISLPVSDDDMIAQPRDDGLEASVYSPR